MKKNKKNYIKIECNVLDKTIGKEIDISSFIAQGQWTNIKRLLETITESVFNELIDYSINEDSKKT